MDTYLETTKTPARVSKPQQRRRFSVAKKLDLVRQCLAPGASVSRIARAHDLNTNQLFNWMRQYERGLLGPRDLAKLLPVRIEPVAPKAVSVVEHAPASVHRSESSGTIEIILGEVRVLVRGSVDPVTVRTVLTTLSSR